MNHRSVFSDELEMLDLSQKTYSLCDMAQVYKKAQPIATKALMAISRAGPGYVFTPAELVRNGVGPRPAVNQALSRLVKAGHVRRLGTGIYHLPKRHRLVGEIPPTSQAIAMAMARATGEALQVSEAEAANRMGMSTQVPGKIIYWTNGTPRVRHIGNTTIQFKRGSPQRLAGAGSSAGVVLQAIRALGPEGARHSISHLRRVLPAAERRKLLKAAAASPNWVVGVAEQIVGESTNG